MAVFLCFFSVTPLISHERRCNLYSRLDCFVESRLEGWLSIPNRANIKRYGWKKQVRNVYSGFPPCCCHCLWNVRPLEDHAFLSLSFFPKYFQYVVVSSKKILFYNDEQDKEQSNPSMVLDIEWVPLCLVRHIPWGQFILCWLADWYVSSSSAVNCSTWDQSLKEMCIELRQRRFQGYSRFVTCFQK